MFCGKFNKKKHTHTLRLIIRLFFVSSNFVFHNENQSFSQTNKQKKNTEAIFSPEKTPYTQLYVQFSRYLRYSHTHTSDGPPRNKDEK